MSTVTFCRETLSIDDTLPGRIASSTGVAPQPGDTLFLGATNCTLSLLSPHFSYVIASDNVNIATSDIRLKGTPQNPRCNITICAKEIEGSLHLSSAGLDGRPGAPGKDGSGTLYTLKGGPPHVPGTPGGDGVSGQPGQAGWQGGNITIHYCSAMPRRQKLPRPVPDTVIKLRNQNEGTVSFTAEAPGGTGGAGGKGGRGGAGTPMGKNGADGKPGAAGSAGNIDIRTVPLNQIWQVLDHSFASAWAEYRAELGEYYFRLYGTNQITALSEFNSALQLDPANLHAKTLRSRLLQQQIPSGLARDVDVYPDYKDLSQALPAETQLVMSEFLQGEITSLTDEVAEATKDQLNLLQKQLSDRLAEAAANVTVANDGVQIANQQDADLQNQLDDLDQQIRTAQNQGFTLGDLLSTVGAIAGVITGIATGIGGIVSIPAGIAAIGTMFSSGEGALDVLKSEFSGQQPNNQQGQAGTGSNKLNNLGSDLKDIYKGASDTVVNFQKVIADIDGSNNNDTVKKLLSQKASLTMQKMISDLRKTQAADQLTAAQLAQTDYSNEVQMAETTLLDWAQTDDYLKKAYDVLLGTARRLSDLVATDIFIARRALEIYQLQDASDVHFDYGYIHPDQDHDLAQNPLRRMQECLKSLNQMPSDVISWNQIYTELNVAGLSGFDTVHVSAAVTIDDPAILSNLKQGQGLQFSITPDGVPPDVFELKVDSLSLELDGASAQAGANVWIEHSGHWEMISTPDANQGNTSEIVTFCLSPHLEAFEVAGTPPKLTSNIPLIPQSPAEPGPPFSFWGRGVIADWELYPEVGKIDFSDLTAVKLTFNCFGFQRPLTAPRSISMKPTLRVIPARRFGVAA